MAPDAGVRQEGEADLVALVAGGDTSAFERLTDRYYRPVAAFIFKRVQSAGLVEDLTQETFLEAFRALKEGTVPAHFSSWLFGIAHNRCGKWLRRKRPVLFDPSEAPEPEAGPSGVSLLEEKEEQDKLLAALDAQLAGLPQETRNLLDLKHRQGKTCEEIAAALGRPVGTIKSLLSRTYRALRAALGPRGD
jgi:RNA polymerase sigma-70 factor (ECF subfamily)